MHERDLSPDQTTSENVWRVPKHPAEIKDLTAAWMCPPATTDLAADNLCSQTWNRPATTLKDDTVLPNEVERFLRRHVVSAMCEGRRGRSSGCEMSVVDTPSAELAPEKV
jgi:hypothetical protein